MAQPLSHSNRSTFTSPTEWHDQYGSSGACTRRNDAAHEAHVRTAWHDFSKSRCQNLPFGVCPASLRRGAITTAVLTEGREFAPTGRGIGVSFVVGKNRVPPAGCIGRISNFETREVQIAHLHFVYIRVFVPPSLSPFFPPRFPSLAHGRGRLRSGTEPIRSSFLEHPTSELFLVTESRKE